MYENLKNKNLFNFDETIAADIFTDIDFPWEVLPKIKDFITGLGESLSPDDYDKKGDNVWIAKSAAIAPTATILILNDSNVADLETFLKHYRYKCTDVPIPFV